jgi:hypothetical protein
MGNGEWDIGNGTWLVEKLLATSDLPIPDSDSDSEALASLPFGTLRERASSLFPTPKLTILVDVVQQRSCPASC